MGNLLIAKSTAGHFFITHESGVELARRDPEAKPLPDTRFDICYSGKEVLIGWGDSKGTVHLYMVRPEEGFKLADQI